MSYPPYQIVVRLIISYRRCLLDNVIRFYLSFTFYSVSRFRISYVSLPLCSTFFTPLSFSVSFSSSSRIFLFLCVQRFLFLLFYLLHSFLSYFSPPLCSTFFLSFFLSRFLSLIPPFHCLSFIYTQPVIFIFTTHYVATLSGDGGSSLTGQLNPLTPDLTDCMMYY